MRRSQGDSGDRSRTVMSFILDALRKSENARLRQEHPAMFDARPVAVRRRFPGWFLALGLLLGLNLAVLLFVLLRDERAAAPTAAAPLTTGMTVPAAVASATPAATTAAPSMPAAPSARDADRPPTGAATVADSVSKGRPDAAAVAAAPSSVPPAMPARTRDDLLATGDAVPEAQVSLHVYDADPAKRFVFLNGQRLREGDVTADGLRVERIDADGVVLDHRGSDFKVALEP